MRFLFHFLIFTGLILSSACALASSVRIDNAHAKASFPMAQTAAVYFSMMNSTPSPRTLMEVSVDPTVADDAQLHTTELEGEMMRMREVTEGLTVQAGETRTLQPGGYHVMLLGLKKGLSEGEDFSLTLTFKNGETLTTPVSVKPADTGQTHHHHQGHE